MNALKRLEQQLDERDSKNEELESKVQELTDESEANWKWARHRTIKKDVEGLPVPRLEIRCTKETDDWYMWRWDYALIYKHFLGHSVSIPLGQTRVQGGNGKPPIREGKMDTPFRDGVHISHDSASLNLPAFGICEGQVEKISMKDGKVFSEVIKLQEAK